MYSADDIAKVIENIAKINEAAAKAGFINLRLSAPADKTESEKLHFIADESATVKNKLSFLDLAKVQVAIEKLTGCKAYLFVVDDLNDTAKKEMLADVVEFTSKQAPQIKKFLEKFVSQEKVDYNLIVTNKPC